jgi:hypothetical protein
MGNLWKPIAFVAWNLWVKEWLGGTTRNIALHFFEPIELWKNIANTYKKGSIFLIQYINQIV